MGRGWLKLIAGPALFLLLALLPPLPLVEEAAALARAPSPKSPQVALGGLLWIATWWVTEAVPLGLTGLLAAALFSLLGFVPWSTALTSFTHPIIWIFIGGFVLAAAFRKWGVDRRAALAVARLYRGTNPALVALSVCLPAFFLTVTGSITASTSVVYPIALSLLSLVGASDSYAEATMLALGEAATAGALLFLTSTPPNLIAKQVLESSLPGFRLTFIDWLIVGTPQAVAGLLISWLVTFRLLRVEEREVRVPEAVGAVAPLSLEEKLVLAVFAATLALWTAPGLAAIAASFEPGLEPLARLLSAYLPEAAPAALAVLALGLVRTGRGPLLTMREISEGVDWNVIFMFGGGLAMGVALDASGFSRWLALAISRAGALDEFSLSAVAALLGFAITFPASNTAAAMITVPLVAAAARGAGLNPVAPVISAALACSISSALPSTTPPMAIVYGSGKVRATNMFKVGIVSDVLRLAVLVLTEPHLVNLLLALKRVP